MVKDPAPAEPRYRLRILHISDLHERGSREREGWRRRQVLGDAWDANLAELLQDGPIDLVCFTGDLADWGKAEEYRAASELLRGLLERLYVPADRLFVIPGNHDIDRTVEPQAWKTLRELIPQSDSLMVSRWMAGGKETPPGFTDSLRVAVLERQRAYRTWLYRDFGRPELDPTAGPHGHLGYRATVQLPRIPFPIHLLGLDTAWLAGDDEDAHRLLLTDSQAMTLATDKEGRPLPGLRIALLHHPFEDLADGAASRRMLSGHVDLFLRGHLHETETTALAFPSGTIRQLATGCLYEGHRADQWPNACQLLTLNLDAAGGLQSVDLRLRAWSPRGRHWHDDDSLYEQSRGGRLRWNFAAPQREEKAVALEKEAAGGVHLHPMAPPLGGSSIQMARSIAFLQEGDPMAKTPVGGPEATDDTNPYDPWTPVAPERFVGRKKLFRQLQEAVDGGHSISIVGDWRIGKSSVLTTWKERLQQSGREVRSVSGEEAEGESPSAWVKKITGQAAPDGADAAANVLDEWVHAVAKPGLPPVILADELDGIITRFDTRFFERLRGMMGRVVVVFASRWEIDRSYEKLGRTSPFGNRMQTHSIGLLEADAANYLVTRSVRLNAADQELIRDWAGRHPFYIQLLGHYMEDARRHEDELGDAMDRFRMEAASRLRELWRVLEEAERTLLRDCLRGNVTKRLSLRTRGLVTDEGKIFGKVMEEWLREEA